MVISGCSLLFVYMKYNAPQLCSILVSYFSKIWQLILFVSDNAYFRCNILKRVPNSALWLLRFPAAGEMRLRACMCSRMGVRSFQIFVIFIVCFSNSWTTFRCCCTRGTARSNYFYRCCNEERTHQTELFSWLIPWHVITDPYFCV